MPRLRQTGILLAPPGLSLPTLSQASAAQETIMCEVRYPNVRVKLIGENRSALNILRSISSAMRKAGLSREQIKEFMETAMASEQDTLMMETMKFVAAPSAQKGIYVRQY
jgi:hypothetical protein